MGLTLYWFGQQWPWGENEVAAASPFTGPLTGTYSGHVDETGAPDFYTAFAVGHNRPLAISETAALYNASNASDASELSIKSAWMDQVFGPANGKAFPKLKVVNWFDHEEFEQESYGLTDWRATYNRDVGQAFGQHVTASEQYLFVPVH